MNSNDADISFGNVVESLEDFGRLVEQFNILQRESSNNRDAPQLHQPPPPPPPPSPPTSSSLTPFINSVCDCGNQNCLSGQSTYVSEDEYDAESYSDDDPFKYESSRLIIKVSI